MVCVILTNNDVLSGWLFYRPLSLLLETLNDGNPEIVLYCVATLANIAITVDNHMQVRLKLLWFKVLNFSIKEESFESLRLIRVCFERNMKHQCHKYKAALYCEVISNVFTIALKMVTRCYVSSGASYWRPAFRWRPFAWVQTLATKP